MSESTWNWEKIRDPNGYLQLSKWWKEHKSHMHHFKFFAGLAYIQQIERLHPIKSRQVGAMIIATAEYIASKESA